MTVLSLHECKGVSGDLASVVGLTHLTNLNLYGTSVTAPDGCPKDEDGGIYRPLYYPDAAACGELLAWLNNMRRFVSFRFVSFGLMPGAPS